MSRTEIAKWIAEIEKAPERQAELGEQLRLTGLESKETYLELKKYKDALKELRTPTGMIKVREDLGDILDSYKTFVHYGVRAGPVFDMVTKKAEAGLKTFGISGAMMRDMMKDASELGSALIPQLEMYEELGSATRKMSLYTKAYRSELVALREPEVLTQLPLRIDDIIDAYGDLITRGREYSIEEAKIEAEAVGLGEALKLNRREFKEFENILITSGVEPAKQYAQQVSYNKDRLLEWKQSVVDFNAMLGRQGRALQMLTRTIFWVGLGSMFIMMSWSRMRRSALSLQSTMLTLKRAYITQGESQQELNEITAVYGKSSVEAKRAMIDLEMANMRVKQSEEALRMAEEQRIYTQMMWVFGSVPTYIRSAVDVSKALWFLFFAKQINVSANKDQATSSITSAIMTRLLGDAAMYSSTKFWMLATAIGAVTFGLNIALSLLAQHVAFAEASRNIKKMQKEAAELTSIYEGQSPGLLDDL